MHDPDSRVRVILSKKNKLSSEGIESQTGPSDTVELEESEPPVVEPNASILLVNTRRGARSKIDHSASMEADLLLLTELDLAEHSVGYLSSAVTAHDRIPFFGAPTALTKSDGEPNVDRRGRRVAILAKDILSPKVPPSSAEDGLIELRQSGRWTKMTFPIDDDGHFATVAVFYGSSGANAGGQDCAMNERLLTMVVARQLAAGDEPYLVCMDANVTESQSPVLTTALHLSKIINLRDDRVPESAGHPTFMFGGITDEILAGEKGSSTIDHLYANPAFNLLVDGVQMRWDLCEGLDHVPLSIQLNFAAVSSCVARPSTQSA